MILAIIVIIIIIILRTPDDLQKQRERSVEICL
jgi:hypothetical protein